MDRSQLKIARQFGEGSNWSVVGNSIKRATFYLPDGTSRELLADAYHLQRYLSRGFTLSPPEAVKTDKSVTETVVAEKPRRKRRTKKRISK
jgi:hypothetical protein